MISSKLQLVLAVVFALTAGVWPARSDEPGAKERAAQAYDKGVELFGRAEFAQAARAFLQADSLAPNATALVNAMTAARRAGDHLTAALAAERAIERGADLALRGREVLAEASTHLSRLDIACEPHPCELTIDGEAATEGQHFVLPGTHGFAASGKGEARAQEHLTVQAGALYRILLHPVAVGHQSMPATVDRPARAARAAPPVVASRGAGNRTGLSPSVFYIGVGLTIVLAGFTTWSGLDTLASRRELSSDPTTDQVDSVRSKMHRTDYLLGGTALLAGATAVAGLGLVDWSSGQGVQTALIPATGGATLSASGRF